MDTVGCNEAKMHLSKLIEKAARGESITITKHGVPVARLVPASGAGKADARAVIEELKRRRKGRKLNDISIRELIEEGRQ